MTKASPVTAVLQVIYGARDTVKHQRLWVWTHGMSATSSCPNLRLAAGAGTTPEVHQPWAGSMGRRIDSYPRWFGSAGNKISLPTGRNVRTPQQGEKKKKKTVCISCSIVMGNFWPTLLLVLYHIHLRCGMNVGGWTHKSVGEHTWTCGFLKYHQRLLVVRDLYLLNRFLQLK